jgi:hypothetical protein
MRMLRMRKMKNVDIHLFVWLAVLVSFEDGSKVL